MISIPVPRGKFGGISSQVGGWRRKELAVLIDLVAGCRGTGSLTSGRVCWPRIRKPSTGAYLRDNNQLGQLAPKSVTFPTAANRHAQPSYRQLSGELRSRFCMGDDQPAGDTFRVLTVFQGQWGQRITENIQKHAPSDWSVESWTAPRVLPPIIDDPEDFLPPSLPPAHLVLALGEVPGLAQLVPDIVRLCGARSVIAPIDRSSSLPAGLAHQLEQWLDAMGVASVFPKPFCSLGQTSYNHRPSTKAYDDPIIRRFADHFGRPNLHVDVAEGKITNVDVLRDAACGCTRYVAERLIGVEIDESVERAGLLHHHFPCLASMNKEQEYLDTLMHVSGNILKEALKSQIKSHYSEAYLRPNGLIEETSNPEE